MATNVEVLKWLLDVVNRGNLEGHFLHVPLTKFHLFSWATVKEEMDITHLANDARRLWLFQVRVAARDDSSCRTLVRISCPERYRLLISGQPIVQHQVELMTFLGGRFSQRPSFEIVDHDPEADGVSRYLYEGHASTDAGRMPVKGALDLV